MKALSSLCILAPIMIAGTVGAATISGSLNPLAGSADLSTGVDDWAYYGANGSATGVDVKAGGPGSFSAISNGAFSATDSRVGISYNGGTPTLNLTNGTAFVFGAQNASGSLSFTVALTGGQQLLQVYLVSYNSRANITATVSSGGSYSLTGAILPSTNDGDLAGTGHSNGLLSLDISNATAGDVLTFTIQNNYAGVADSSFGFTGIQAASLTAVPETSTLSILVLSSLLIAKRKRA